MNIVYIINPFFVIDSMLHIARTENQSVYIGPQHGAVTFRRTNSSTDGKNIRFRFMPASADIFAVGLRDFLQKLPDQEKGVLIARDVDRALEMGRHGFNLLRATQEKINVAIREILNQKMI